MNLSPSPGPALWQPPRSRFARGATDLSESLTSVLASISNSIQGQQLFRSGCDAMTLTQRLPMDSLPTTRKNGPQREANVMARNRKSKGWVRYRNGRWTIHWRERDGAAWKLKFEAVPGARNEADARKVLDRKMERINKANETGRPETLDFAGFSQQWLKHLERRGAKPSTLLCYGSLVNARVLPVLGSRPLECIGPADIAGLLADIEAAGKSAVTTYAMLKSMFELARQMDLIEKSPVRPKLHRPVSRTKEKAVLTPEQIRRVEAEFPAELRVLFCCAVLSGLRLGELLALRWRDLDLEARTLTVSHTLWRGRLLKPKTESSGRTIRISGQLADRLKEQRAHSWWTGPDDFVFARADGSPQSPNQLRIGVLAKALDRAGIARVKGQHGFHLLRHSVGSILYAETRDLKLAQKVLGHSEVGITGDIYTHLADEIVEDGMETLAQAIWPVSEGSDTIQ